MSRRSVGIAISVAVSAALLPAVPAQAAGHTLVVDVARPFRPVTHAASGGLYALAENNRPADSTLLPIRMHTLPQPAPGVGQRPNGQPPGGDSLRIAPQADRVGAAQVIRTRDTVTPIAGPSYATYEVNRMRTFLTVARNINVLPDVMIWHELNHSSADRAFWYEYGTVNGLVVNNNQPTGSWWLYKWYGDMAGQMVATTPPAQTGIDGFASYDSTRRRVAVLFGDESGTNAVRVTGLGGLGSSVRVTLESTPASGRFTAVTAPTTIADSAYTVSNGQITVNVPTARSYTMTIAYANGTGATSTHGLAHNGGAWSTVSYPPTAGWAQFGTVSTAVNLRAGYNVVRLAKGSPFLSGATGHAELDYIQLA